MRSSEEECIGEEGKTSWDEKVQWKWQESGLWSRYTEIHPQGAEVLEEEESNKVAFSGLGHDK